MLLQNSRRRKNVTYSLMVIIIATVLGWYFHFLFMNVVWLTAFNMPKKERYSKENQEKIVVQ